MHRLSFIALLAAAGPIAAAHAGERMHYLYLVNRAHDGIVSVATTPAGGSAWTERLHGDKVHGGGDAATVQLASDQCVHDVKVAFVNGRTALYPAVDLCRHRGLRIPPLPARDRRALAGAQRVPASSASRAAD